MRVAIFLALFGASLASIYGAAPRERAAQGLAWAPSDSPWKRDPVWHDGLAEVCAYDATREIYGVAREYVALAYTNKEHVDPETTCKSPDGRGLEVFKQHASEIVPTENYSYRFSTSTYTESASLRAFKLTVSTQEDCGASFKLIVKDGRSFAFSDSVYFPGAGQRRASLGRADEVHFVDELPLLLRDFPFDSAADRTLLLVPSQKDVRQAPFEPVRATVSYVGRETASLPIGERDTHRLRVELADGSWAADYWMLADGAAPSLHALARYVGPRGESYALRSQRRYAYWER